MGTRKSAGKSKASIRMDVGQGTGAGIYPRGGGRGAISRPVDIPSLK